MDYDLMYRRLVAVRKEIRQNVPMLKLIDDFYTKFDRDFEQMMWVGSHFATDEYRVNTRI